MMIGSLARVSLALGLVLGVHSAPGLAEQPESNGSRYSPYAGIEHPTRVSWGDTHHHTANPGDAFMNVNRLSPEDAYRFARATWTNSIGDPDLAVAWQDPDFDASQPAFYDARVIEIPTPHWTAYDAFRSGVKMSEDVPMDHQERGWTSPIWYASPE